MSGDFGYSGNNDGRSKFGAAAGAPGSAAASPDSGPSFGGDKETRFSGGRSSSSKLTFGSKKAKQREADRLAGIAQEQYLSRSAPSRNWRPPSRAAAALSATTGGASVATKSLLGE